MVKVLKKEGESASALLFRFSKKIKQSGVLREAKRRRFRQRPLNKRKRLVSALHREKKKSEIERLKKLGLA
ncbi:MAG: 30S ribosomal protein S21 [Candidatus Liptonbacteria bacterium]|nr:30S ribosomal protein S21 [Candidatus Liptonbacteria bacterium]